MPSIMDLSEPVSVTLFFFLYVPIIKEGVLK
jgi:hypothetical protein